MNFDDLSRLSPEALKNVAGGLFERAITTIVERLLEQDPETIPARPLYNVFEAFATGELGNLHSTIRELGTIRTDDEDPRIKREIVRRLALAYELHDDPAAQAMEEAKCRADVGYWITNWGWARDPERDGLRVLPFVPFERQLELLEWIEARIAGKEPGYLDKGRKVGASYIVAFFATHRWKYFEHWTTFLSSYNEATLHTQNKPDECIIEKVRVVLQGLPTWQIPSKFNERDHFNFCSVFNPNNGASIAGILPRNNNLRATRATVAFLDEFPFYDNAREAWSIIGDVTHTPIGLGTPNPGSYAAELLKRVPTFVFPWTDDPRKSQTPVEVEVRPGQVETMPEFKAAWLAGGTRTEADFEREHCCNSDIALTQNVIKPEWIDSATRIDLEPAGECVYGLDPAGLGADESALARREGPVVAPLEVWQQDLRETTIHAAGLVAINGGEFLYFDASGMGAKCRDHLARMSKVPFEWFGVFAQTPPPAIFIGDDEDPATERYADWTTMLWFELAARLHRTHLHTTGQRVCQAHEMIKLPVDDVLREQLLARRWEWRNNRIKLEDKKKMKKSPDRADAVTLTLCGHLQRERRRKPDKSEVLEDVDRQMRGSGLKIEF